MFVPMDVEIGGTGLTAMTREDQDGWDVNGARVPKSGTGDITVHGASFHVWQIDGDLFGARFDKAINSDSAGDSDTEAGFGLAGDLNKDNRMTLTDDNEDTVANELRTGLTVGGNTFTMADLLGAGSASASGDNFVASARGAIEKIRGDVAALLGLDTAPTGIDGILDSRWGAIQTEVNKVFGAGKVNLGANAPDDDDMLGEIDDILAALSSGTQFAAATDGDGSGVFKGAALSESAALEAFEANQSESGIVFGSTGETRYGAISQKEREYATSDLTYKDADDATAAGLVGAFSYATTNDVVRVWHIQTSGNAYYEGGTTAVSGDGTLYSGDIELEVKFSSKRVSGLVTGLQTAEGDPWQYQFGDVEAIILPTATDLDNNAHWGASEDTARAQVTFERRAGSPSPQTVVSTFAGQLLGTGDASGDWAHGVWTVGSNSASGTSRYLAGSFGASRVADTAPVRPGTDDGSGVETLATSNDWLAADATRPNSFKVADGKLTVTMNLFERVAKDAVTASLRLGSATVTNVLEADPADPDGSGAGRRVSPGLALVVLDTDTGTAGLQAPTQELSVSLATLIANAGTEVNTNGPKNQVEIAVEKIETARADLAVLQALDTRITGSEEAAWKKVQTALLGVFHHVPTKLAGSYDEDRALGLIDSVLEAFSTSASLKAAIDPDGSGVFNTATDGTGGNAGSPSSYSVIWGRQAVQMKAMADATDYTRVGGWWVQQDAFADGETWWWPSIGSDNGLPGNSPGLFAYSPLPATQWSSSGDPSFPLGGSATFTGKTVAFQAYSNVFFEGTVEVLAEWTADVWQGVTADIGELTMTIRGLMSADGDPLRAHHHVSRNPAPLPNVPAGTPLESVTFRNIPITVDASGNVGFGISNAGETSNTAPILAFGPLGTQTAPLLRDVRTWTSRHSGVQGRFVGQDVDGPLAVLGTYWLAARGEYSGSLLFYFTGGPVEGAFGADRP